MTTKGRSYLWKETKEGCCDKYMEKEVGVLSTSILV